jgi:4-azaleucine resistance transporter AzlC
MSEARSTERAFAFKTTIPILLGYLAIGFAFGLIVQSAGYGWYIALLASVLIYAGAGQYALAGMFTTGASLPDIAMAIFLINSRHMVYGLSLLDKFKNTAPYTPYMIFGLTDETYGVLTTVKVPEHLDKKKSYFLITLFDQLYWIIGGLIGFFAGVIIPFDFAGVDFALTALFVVLLIEQWRNCAEKLPFAIAGVCAVAAVLIVGPKNMLIASFVAAIVLLLVFRRQVRPC